MIKHENIFLIFLFLLSLLDMAMEKSPSPKPNICFIREFSLLRILKMQIMATFTAAVPNKDFPAYQQKYLETVVTKNTCFWMCWCRLLMLIFWIKLRRRLTLIVIAHFGFKHLIHFVNFVIGWIMQVQIFDLSKEEVQIREGVNWNNRFFLGNSPNSGPHPPTGTV